MAAHTTFKQPCPSCEARIPIRDPQLIGRKIDCPKCKYRFTVPFRTAAVEDAPPGRPAGFWARLPGAVALFCYRAARLLALVAVGLAGVALMLCTVVLVVACALCVSRIPSEAGLLAMLFAIATAVAVGVLLFASWVVERIPRGRERTEPALPEVSPSDAPAAVRERFQHELTLRGVDPEANCVFVPEGHAAAWYAAALRRAPDAARSSEALTALAIPELSRAKRSSGRGWCWRGASAVPGGMGNLPGRRPREGLAPVTTADRLASAWLGVIAGLIVAPLFALTACSFLAPSEAGRTPEAVARSSAALLPACAVAAAVTCGLFGGVRGFYYGGPVGAILFVQCLLDCTFLNLVGNLGSTKANRQKLGLTAVLLMLAILVFLWLGVRAQPIGPDLEDEPSGLAGRTTCDFMREFAFTEPLGGWWAELRWWAGLFSYLACVLLAGLLAAALLPV